LTRVNRSVEHQEPTADVRDVFGQRYSQMVPVELMHFRVE